MLLVIEIVFSVPVISRIEFIGVGRWKGAGVVGGGGGHEIHSRGLTASVKSCL